jgi:hypothetical protein
MTKLASLLLLGTALVGLVQLLPRPRFGRLFYAALFVVSGFILAECGVSATIAALGLVPKGPFHDLLHELTDNDDRRSVVLLIGSSFTGAGVDADRLAQALSSSGRATLVQSFAVGGAPHVERLHYLREYLARAKRTPDLVLFEIAGGYDNNPLYQVHQMRFSDRMVAAMDGSTALWSLRWLAGDKALGLSERLILGSEVLAQLALHVSHIGYLWNSAPVYENAAYEAGGSPPPIQFSDKEVTHLLEEAAGARELKPDWPAHVPNRWMSAFLEEEIATLRRYGVERFAFYLVPSMQGANVAYARRFCAAMSEFVCIIGEDPGLLARLGRAADWYDFDHLQGHGREVFTTWLGDRFVESGVWP